MGNEKNKLKPIDAPAYGYWSAFCMSFYSRHLYVDVGKRWQGLGILYLLLLIALFSIPYFLRLADNLNDTFNDELIGPLSEIPVFYIQNGDISFNKPMPYLIKNSKGDVVAVIDSTGKINDFKDYPHLSILINKNKISIRVPSPQLFMMTMPQTNKSTPLVQTFDKGTNIVFDGKKLAEENSIVEMKYFTQVLMYLVIVSIFFSVFLVFFLVLGFLGEVFSNIFFSFKLKFKQSVRLLIVAGTPMLVSLFIVLTLNFIFHGLGIILMTLLVGYYSFAIYSLKAESKHVVIS